jgi:hypothetical protein
MPVRQLLLLLFGTNPLAALACSPCRAYVQAGIFDGSFAVKLLVMTAPVLLVIIGAVILYVSGKAKG